MSAATASAPAPSAAASENLHRGIITICAMIATLMQVLDNTIANVALPYMQGSLSTTPDQITWVLTSYVIAAAIMTAPVGWLTARFGRKTIFVTCVAGFTIASILCGLAGSLTQIVLFRLLQGMFGAALVPLSQSTMLDLYSIEQRGSAMAVWGMGVMVGPILGPTLGGYLTDAYNWRWVFYINVPFGIISTLGLWFFLKDNARNATLKFDWTGFAVLSLGLGALQLFLDRGEQKDWLGSTEIVIYVVLCGLGFYLFAVHMWLAEKPFITPSIFLDRNFTLALLVMFLIGIVLLSTSVLLAPYLQVLAGYPVATTGLLMAPRGLGMMIAMLIAGRLVNRFDPRMLMVFGTVVLVYSLQEMTGWTPDIDAWSLAKNGIVQGFGLGFLFIPIQMIAFSTLPASLRTEGTSLISLVRNIGGAMGISITSYLLVHYTQILHAEIAEQVTPFNRMLQTGGAYLMWNLTTPLGITALNHEVTRQASIMAYANDFKFILVSTVPIAFLVLLMKKPKRIAAAASHGATVID
jgi:MFS transporter, DHA2 family, multidrug resistance protein